MFCIRAFWKECNLSDLKWSTFDYTHQRGHSRSTEARSQLSMRHTGPKWQRRIWRSLRQTGSLALISHRLAFPVSTALSNKCPSGCHHQHYPCQRPQHHVRDDISDCPTAAVHRQTGWMSAVGGSAETDSGDIVLGARAVWSLTNSQHSISRSVNSDEWNDNPINLPALVLYPHKGHSFMLYCLQSADI